MTGSGGDPGSLEEVMEFVRELLGGGPGSFWKCRDLVEIQEVMEFIRELLRGGPGSLRKFGLLDGGP